MSWSTCSASKSSLPFFPHHFLHYALSPHSWSLTHSLTLNSLLITHSLTHSLFLSLSLSSLFSQYLRVLACGVLESGDARSLLPISLSSPLPLCLFTRFPSCTLLLMCTCTFFSLSPLFFASHSHSFPSDHALSWCCPQIRHQRLWVHASRCRPRPTRTRLTAHRKNRIQDNPLPQRRNCIRLCCHRHCRR